MSLPRKVVCALQCEVLNLLGPSSDSPSVQDGANLVYCAPTSGGKSLVSEVLMLRRICETNRPALLVSIVNCPGCGGCCR
jgi:hypothetical protein